MADVLTWGAYRQPDGTYDASAKVVYDPPIVDGTVFQSGRGMTGYRYPFTAYLASLGQAFKLYRQLRKDRRLRP